MIRAVAGETWNRPRAAARSSRERRSTRQAAGWSTTGGITGYPRSWPSLAGHTRGCSGRTATVSPWARIRRTSPPTLSDREALASDLGFALPQSARTRYGPAQPRRAALPPAPLNPPCSPGMERPRSATLTPGRRARGCSASWITMRAARPRGQGWAISQVCTVTSRAEVVAVQYGEPDGHRGPRPWGKIRTAFFQAPRWAVRCPGNRRHTDGDDLGHLGRLGCAPLGVEDGHGAE
jgi:hypothetical protein